MRKLWYRSNKGFSLVEIIIAIAIMAVLIGVTAPTLVNNIEKSKESTDLQTIDSVRQAVLRAMVDKDINDAHSGLLQLCNYKYDSQNGVNYIDGAGNEGEFSTLLQEKLKEEFQEPVQLRSSVATSNDAFIQIVVYENKKVVVRVIYCTETEDKEVTCKFVKKSNGERVLMLTQ